MDPLKYIRRIRITVESRHTCSVSVYWCYGVTFVMVLWCYRGTICESRATYTENEYIYSCI